MQKIRSIDDTMAHVL